MTPNPRIRPHSAKTTSSREEKPADQATAFFSTQPPQNVTQVAETLAAHGGGAVSMGLAFDLVLNDLVEQVREASGATGAAIALIRDGEMVCRATSGENAPDLGVRVETGSSLAGACLATGEIQLCRDTEADSRVSAEACRRLGVRSMVLAPLIDGGSTFGILQAFSAWPNSFGEREISALKGLTERITESKREAEGAGVKIAASVEQAAGHASGALSGNVRTGEDEETIVPSEYSAVVEPEKPKEKEIWTSILVLLVIAAAVLLGVVIGWSGAVKGWIDPQPARTSAASASAPVRNTPQQPATPRAAATTPSTPDSAADGKTASTADSAPTPAGGLVITHNGKVIYRMRPSDPGSASRSNAESPSGTRLLHRVEPDYPAVAREKNIQGPVVLDVEIGGNGMVENVDVVSGEPVLAEAAVKAVKQWRYQPSFVDGRPVESQTRITIKFILPL